MTNDGTSLHIDELLAVDESSITTLIDVGVTVTGKISVTNGTSLLISGCVDGEVESNGAILVNLGGIIRGSVKAKSLQVAGLIERIKDDDLIQVFGPMILAETAVVNCDVVSEGLKSSYGAVMNGSFRPHASRVAKAVPANDEAGASGANENTALAVAA